MAIDRESAVKKAEELVREGKIDLAIEEYVRLVEDQPADFGAGNALGDLYAKIGNRPLAAARFVQIGDSHRDSGFVPKAVAFYKKALKVDPASDHALSQLAQIAVEQELFADATLYLNRLIQHRREHKNDTGVAECLVRLAGFPSATADAKMAAARASANHFTPEQTARLWVDAADALARAGRTADVVDALMQAATLQPDDAELRRRVALACATAGQIDRARAFLSFETAGDHPDLLLALAGQALADGREADARRALERVIEVAPERRVEAQAMLAPLTAGSTPAPSPHQLPEDFFAVEGDEPIDVAAAFGAETGDAPDESEPVLLDAFDAVEANEPAARLEPDPVTEPEPAPEPVAEPAAEPEAEPETEPAPVETPVAVDTPAAAAGELEWSSLLGEGGDEPEPKPETLVEASDDAAYVVPDDEPVVETVEEPAVVLDTVPIESAVVETASEPTPEPEPEPAPAVSQADLDSIAALSAAARNPALQFQASAQLGRLLLRLGRGPEGIEWLEKATQVATSVREQRLDVMYELADALERAGERTRALDVFADLDFDATSYRDVPERIAALRRGSEEGRVR